MQTIIRPSKLKGSIQAPASKSSMQRACAAALLHRGETLISNPGYSNDDKAALGVVGDLGAKVYTQADGTLRVISRGLVSPDPGAVVNCGESGLGIRMFAPIIALTDQQVTINGEGSLMMRPMDFFDEIFPQLDIDVVSNNGKLPLQLQGPLRPRTITIDGSLSSQFLTGLLFAYAAAGAQGVSINVNNLKSKPYIDLTLHIMHYFGWEVENRNYEAFYFPGNVDGKKSSGGPEGGIIRYTVEGDWSGGAFLLVAGALAGPVRVKGLDPASTQADKVILRALEDCGAYVVIEDGEIGIGPGDLKAFSFDATDCPDLFPPLVALAAYCEGVTVIDGVSRLAHKESNRALTLQEEFGKLGLEIGLEGDRMRVIGGGGLRGSVVHSRHDHRIAMACAVAGLRAGGETRVEDAEAIDKSYPDFYAHLQRLGADVAITIESTEAGGKI